MRDCFILGAGFSRAVGENMPLMGNLADPLIPDYVKKLRGYEHLLTDGKLPIPDVEVWLSSLAESQPYRDRAENLEAQALFFEIVRFLAFDLRMTINGMLAVSDGPPPWLELLIRTWHEREATVITFNYDTLVESTLANLEIFAEGGTEKLSYKRLPPGLVPFWEVMAGGLRLRPERTFRLLKLHGSLNWYWDPDGKASPVDIGIYERWGEDHPPDDSETHFRAPGLEPFLVPPTTGKSLYLDQPMLREIWSQAKRELEKSSAIYSLGYSFPVADLSLRAMLGNSIRGRAITVVDPSKRAARSLSNLVPNLQIDETFSGREQAIESFVEKYANAG